MLDGLRDIDWSKLTHAYGAADDVPELLEMLLTEDEHIIRQRRMLTLSRLMGKNTVYDVAPYVAPFLLNIAQHAPRAVSRWAALFIISTMTNRFLHVASSSVLEQVRAILKQGMPFYLNCLEHYNDSYVGWVASIVANYPEEVSVSAPVLCRAIARETNGMGVSYLLLMLHKLLAAALPLPDALLNQQLAFVEPYLNHEHHSVRLVAAEVHILLAGEFSANRAIEIVCDAFIHPDYYIEKLQASFLGYIFESLKHLPASRSLFHLLRCLPYTHEPQAQQIVYFLLEQTLGTTSQASFIKRYGELARHTILAYPLVQHQEPRTTLTSDQRMLVEAIVECDAFWSVKSNVFEVFGLPDTHDELRAFLAQTKPD